MTDYAPLSARLEIEEGRRHCVYLDSLGIQTIGVGFNVDAAHGGGLRDIEIDFIKENRIAESEAACRTYSWFAELDDVRKNAVVDWMYNMGPKTFATFVPTHRCIAAGDWQAVGFHLRNSAAHRQEPARMERLARVMETGIWAP